MTALIRLLLVWCLLSALVAMLWAAVCGPADLDDAVPRLIAVLRAKDEELRNVQAEMAGLAKLAQSNRVEADAMGEIAREWEAEVERLRAAVDGLKLDAERRAAGLLP